MALRTWLIILATMLFGAACTTQGGSVSAARSVFDVRRGHFVDESALIALLTRERFVLLGEKHDNPEHHRLRAELIGQIAHSGRRPALVFEQFDLGNDAALVAAQRSPIDAEELADAGKLDRRAWLWPMHKPLLQEALELGLPIRAGNASTAALEPVIRRGELSVDPRWVSRLSAAAWTEQQSESMQREIAESHCNQLPASLVPRLALAQRVRDAAMAQALLDDATADGAILLAGDGHVRRDLGVPVYLPPADAQETISIGFVETTPQARARADFPRAVLADHPGFDYLWFTDKVDRGDPCEAMQTLHRAPAAK